MSASRRGKVHAPRSIRHGASVNSSVEEGTIDVLSQQTGQIGDGTTWDESLHSWTGDSATLVGSIRADRRFNQTGAQYRKWI
jgi:hypothetical protein